MGPTGPKPKPIRERFLDLVNPSILEESQKREINLKRENLFEKCFNLIGSRFLTLDMSKNEFVVLVDVGSCIPDLIENNFFDELSELLVKAGWKTVEIGFCTKGDNKTFSFVEFVELSEKDKNCLYNCFVRIFLKRKAG